MKKIVSLLMIILLSNCTNIKQIGKLNMISTRNIESKANYVSVRNYMGGGKRELKKLKGKTLDEAIDNVVRNTPNGEFLKNVKIYRLHKLFSTWYAVEGDVWGLSGESNFKGFKVGDIVTWKTTFKRYKGTITELKSDKVVTVRTEDGQIKEVEYEELLKTN